MSGVELLEVGSNRKVKWRGRCPSYILGLHECWNLLLGMEACERRSERGSSWGGSIDVSTRGSLPALGSMSRRRPRRVLDHRCRDMDNVGRCLSTLEVRRRREEWGGCG